MVNAKETKNDGAQKRKAYGAVIDLLSSEDVAIVDTNPILLEFSNLRKRIKRMREMEWIEKQLKKQRGGGRKN